MKVEKKKKGGERTLLTSVHEMVTVGCFLKGEAQGRSLMLAFSRGEAKYGRGESQYAPNISSPHWTPSIGLH